MQGAFQRQCYGARVQAVPRGTLRLAPVLTDEVDLLRRRPGEDAQGRHRLQQSDQGQEVEVIDDL